MVKNSLKEIAYYFLRFQLGRSIKRPLIGGFSVFKLVVTTLYTHDMIFSNICNFLVTGILICKMLIFVKWKTHGFVFYLPVKLLLLSLKWKEDYAIDSYINRWKLLYLHRLFREKPFYSYIFLPWKIFEIPWRYGHLLTFNSGRLLTVFLLFSQNFPPILIIYLVLLFWFLENILELSARRRSTK